MGMFGRLFGRGKKEPEGQPPAEQPAAPPTPPPAPQAPAGGEKKRGFFGRIKDKVSRKKKEPEAPPEAPPAAPPGPPAPPPGPPGGPMPEGPEEPKEPEEGPPAKDYSDAPSSLTVKIPGTWVTSKRKWLGTVEGTLSGAQVVEFLKALDEGTKEGENKAVEMVCDEFGDGSFGSGVDVEASSYSKLNF